MTPSRPVALLSLPIALLVAACSGDGPTPTPTAAPPQPTPAAVTREPRPLTTPGVTPTSPVLASSPTPAATATRRPGTTPPPASPTPEPDLSFHFGDDVSVFERTLIITAVEVTRDLLATDAGVEPPVSVFTYRSLDELIDDYSRYARAQPWRVNGMVERLTNALAEASYRGVLINVGHPGWNRLPDTELLRAVAHEYVHVVQLENAGASVADATLRGMVDAVPPAGPLWLIEGSAEVVSWLVVDRLDLAIYPEKRVDLGISARDNPVPLQNMETYLGFIAGGEDGVAMSVLASDYLLTNRDLSELFKFWDDIRRGSRWQDAFVRRFGLPVEAFYANFDTYYRTTFGG